MRINWVARKDINKDLVNDLLEKCIESRHFTNFGKNVLMLEDYLHKVLKIDDDKKVLMVCNGACAINALVATLFDVYKKELRFAVQAFTFPCSKQLLLKDSIVMDIDENMGPSIKMLEERKNDYDAVLITNCFGCCVDINKYVDFCKDNNKILICDNAASPYTFYKGKNISNYGIGSVISLHHTKPIGFGEGGAIIINKEYYDVAKKMINFGYSNNNRYNYDIYASNYKMSEINAIYIYQWLLNLDKIINKYNMLYQYFISKYKGNIYKSYSDDIFIPATIPVILNKDLKYFHEKGIDAKKYYYPLIDCVNAKNIFDHIICFPINLDMTIDDIDYIIDIINDKYQ